MGDVTDQLAGTTCGFCGGPPADWCPGCTLLMCESCAAKHRGSLDARHCTQDGKPWWTARQFAALPLLTAEASEHLDEGPVAAVEPPESAVSLAASSPTEWQLETRAAIASRSTGAASCVCNFRHTTGEHRADCPLRTEEDR